METIEVAPVKPTISLKEFQKVDILIRPARREDVKLMAWLILTAGKAHVEKSLKIQTIQDEKSS